MNPQKFSLSQLLALTLVIASSLALPGAWRSQEICWTPVPLHYEIPDVTGYRIDGQSTKDADRICRYSHREGWELCRRLYYHSDTWDESHTNLPFWSAKNAWTTLYHRPALKDGYRICQQQIEQLLHEHSQKELRQKIGFPKKWLSVPIAIMGWIGLLLVFALRPRKARQITMR